MRYEPMRHGLLTRQDVADLLATISPVYVEENDYMRGYVDALARVAVGLGIAVTSDATQVMEVTYDET